MSCYITKWFFELALHDLTIDFIELFLNIITDRFKIIIVYQLIYYQTSLDRNKEINRTPICKSFQKFTPHVMGRFIIGSVPMNAQLFYCLNPCGILLRTPCHLLLIREISPTEKLNSTIIVRYILWWFEGKLKSEIL